MRWFRACAIGIPVDLQPRLVFQIRIDILRRQIEIEVREIGDHIFSFLRMIDRQQLLISAASPVKGWIQRNPGRN